MTQTWILQVACDAPGCTNSVEVADEKGVDGQLPEPWDSREVGDKMLMACCPRHLAAAILKELEFLEAAQVLMIAGAAAVVPEVPK